MKKTGELLKKAREEKGLSVHEIGLSLKINSKVLKAIEDGDTNSLPAKTFLRGFVQSYAQYLKLNPDEILRVFTEEMGSTRPEVTVSDFSKNLNLEAPPTRAEKVSQVLSNPLPHETAPNNLSALTDRKESPSLHVESRYKNGMVIGVVAILLGLILLTKRVVDRYQKEAEVSAHPEVTSTNPPAEVVPLNSNDMPATEGPKLDPANSPTSTATTGAHPGGSTNSSPSNATPINAPLSGASSSGTNSSGPTSSTAPTNQTAPTATTSTASSVNKTENVTSGAKPSLVESKPQVNTKPALNEPVSTTKPEIPANTAATETAAAPAPPVVKNIEIIFEALDAVELELQTAQGKTEKVSLAAEQVHRLKTKAGLKVNVSNGGAVNIIVNGKDTGVPGVLGQPIKLSY